MPIKTCVSFPRIANYHVILRPLLEDLLPHCDVMPPAPYTQRSLALGVRHSPEGICAPFKQNLGGFIESLDAGANVLMQTGTGCRFACFAEVQERILRDLGYPLTMVRINRGHLNAGLYSTMQELGCPLERRSILGRLWLALRSAALLDHFEDFMRKNMAFETRKGSFSALHQELLRDLERIHDETRLRRIRRYYTAALHSLSFNKPTNAVRIGIVGDLFSVMEPFANDKVEETLMRFGFSVVRRMNASYLLYGRRIFPPLRRTGGYLRYDACANGTDSVAHSREYARRSLDGVLHLRAFGCVPELGVLPALDRLCEDTGLPMLHLSFDSAASDTGLQTRLEAFADMILMKKERRYG